jgi:hypothetical protein
MKKRDSLKLSRRLKKLFFNLKKPFKKARQISSRCREFRITLCELQVIFFRAVAKT